MICLLCLCADNDEQLIDIESAESRRQNTACILYKHFGFCLPEEPTEGFVCQKCWVKVSVFHEFYMHIEYVHRANETIFVESIIHDAKPSLDTNNDEVIPSNANSEQNGTRTHMVDSIKNEMTSDDDDYFNDDFDTDFRDQKVEGVECRSEPNSHQGGLPKSGLRSQGAVEAPVEEQPIRYICLRCNMDFRTPNKLYRHTKKQHDVFEFKCQSLRCIESFTTQEELDMHFCTNHTKIKCPHCDESFPVKQIDQHMRVKHAKAVQAKHTPSDPVICDICGQVFASMAQYKKHHRSVHEVRVITRMECDICKQTYKTRATLVRHLKEHMQGPQICPTCGHISPNRRSLAKHRQVHIAELKERHKCLVCGKGFRDKIKLKEHSHIHTGSAGTHHCNECGKTFRFGSSFSVHKKTMHPKPN